MDEVVEHVVYPLYRTLGVSCAVEMYATDDNSLR